MSRKDTIIVAVLINAGLLVVLFVSSLKQETPIASVKKEAVMPARPAAQPAKKEVAIAKSAPDKVDQVLAQYVKEPQVVKQPVVEEKVVVAKVEPQERKDSSLDIPVLPGKKQEVKLAEEMEKVIVKRGDVLEKIAKNHGVTVGEIMEKNQLTDSKLQIGQVLLLPKKTVHPNPVQLELSVAEKFYVVKDGDNLWKIAMENNVKVEELLKLNKLNEKKAKMLRPGDKLKIR